MMNASASGQREAVEELKALLHMTRFISSQIPDLVPNHLRLCHQLEELEAELEWELEQAKGQNSGAGKSRA
jgi:hypothetical protein